MTITILKDCPFCSGKAVLYSYDPYDGYQGDCASYVVQCKDCLAKIEGRTARKVIVAWNTRINRGTNSTKNLSTKFL